MAVFLLPVVFIAVFNRSAIATKFIFMAIKNRLGGRKSTSVIKQPLLCTEPAHQEVNSSCGSKRYSKEMASFEEARLSFTQCGLSRLDGDGYGVTCEKLCGHGRK